MPNAEIKLNVVTAAAQKALAAFGGAVSSSRTALNAFGSAGASAMSAIGKGVIVLNQGLELFKKAFGTVSQAVQMTLEKALEFRKASDPMVTAFKQIQRESDLVKARLGDVLMPVIVGVYKTFEKATGKLSDYISANRKVFALKVIEWGAAVADTLINVIGGALQALISGWGTFREAINYVKVGFTAFVESILSGVGAVLEGLSGFSAINKLFPEFAEARDKIAEITFAFGESKDAALDAAGTWSTAASMSNANIEVGKKKLLDFVGVAKKAADDIANNDRGGMDETAANYAASIAFRKTVDDNYTKLLKAHLDDRKAYSDGINKMVAEDDKRLAKEKKDQLDDIGEALGNTFGTMAVAAISGNQSVEESFKDMAKSVAKILIELAIKQITANAAVTATEGAKSVAGVPYIGPILAVTAAAAMSAMVMGFIDQLATGGEIRGGTPGRDSVIAALTPGERVLTVSENRQLKSLMRSISGTRSNPAVSQGGMAPAHFAAGGEVQSMQSNMYGGGAITINANFSSLTAPSRVETRRMLTAIAEDMEAMVADGLLLRNVVRT